jgi:hypothetical protein
LCLSPRYTLLCSVILELNLLNISVMSRHNASIVTKEHWRKTLLERVFSSHFLDWSFYKVLSSLFDNQQLPCWWPRRFSDTNPPISFTLTSR